MPDNELPPVLSWDKKGCAHFNAQAAAAAQEREMREWQAVMEAIMREGMAREIDPNRPTPKGNVMPTPLVPGGIPGLQDIHTEITEPGQRYWNRYPTARLRPPERPIARPPREFAPIPPEVEQYRPLIEQYFGPILCTLQEKLTCGPIYTQPMTWLAPPVTAISVDLFTPAAGVTLPGSAYPPSPGDCVDLVAVDVPDRWIFILDRFGNELEDHTAFGDVRFSIQRNRTPIRSYGDFDVQLGRFVNPTKLGTPIILKHKDEFRIKAQSKSATSHKAYARIMGWAFAVRTITGDGAYREFCVQ